MIAPAQRNSRQEEAGNAWRGSASHWRPAAFQTEGPTMPATPATQRRARSWTTVLDGQQLRQLRRQRELSQEKLADLAGISPGTVARLERQHHSPCRGRTLARLAAALGERPTAMSPRESVAADVRSPAGGRISATLSRNQQTSTLA
jgi:DNA-binding XRE family transcriptional regulator